MDLDGCITTDGRLEPRLAELIRGWASFAELSASGRGLHLFTSTPIERTTKAAGVELFRGDDAGGHFLFLTGQLPAGLVPQATRWRAGAACRRPSSA